MVNRIHTLIDAHAHVFDENCNYIEHSRYTPSAKVPIEHYFKTLDDHGIAGAVLIQPSFLGEDNSYMCQAIARRPRTLRGVAVVAPEIEDAALRSLQDQGVRGVRLNLIGQPDPDFTLAVWQDFLTRLVRNNLLIELHASGERWERLLPPLLATGVSIGIEHLGRPDAVDPLSCPGFQAILEAAVHPNVWAKLSGSYRSKGGDAAATVPALLHAFGPKRLLWGSDFPWTQHETGHSMQGCLDWLWGLPLNGEERVAIAEQNARERFDLPR